MAIRGTAGPAWIILEIALFRISTAYSKTLLTSMSALSMNAWRYLWLFLLLLILYLPFFLLASVNFAHELKRAYSLPYVWREGCAFSSGLLGLIGLSLMPLSLATALFFSRAIFMAIYGLAVFGERLTWPIAGAIATGIAGVMILGPILAKSTSECFLYLRLLDYRR